MFTAIPLNLRRAQRSDKEALGEWERDSVRKILFGKKESQIEDSLKTLLSDPSRTLLIATFDNVRIGALILSPCSEGVFDISILIRPPYGMRRFSAQLIESTFNYLRKDHKNVTLNLISAAPEAALRELFCFDSEHQDFCYRSTFEKIEPLTRISFKRREVLQ